MTLQWAGTISASSLKETSLNMILSLWSHLMVCNFTAAKNLTAGYIFGSFSTFCWISDTKNYTFYLAALSLVLTSLKMSTHFFSLASITLRPFNERGFRCGTLWPIAATYPTPIFSSQLQMVLGLSTGMEWSATVGKMDAVFTVALSDSANITVYTTTQPYYDPLTTPLVAVTIQTSMYLNFP